MLRIRPCHEASRSPRNAVMNTLTPMYKALYSNHSLLGRNAVVNFSELCLDAQSLLQTLASLSQRARPSHVRLGAGVSVARAGNVVFCVHLLVQLGISLLAAGNLNRITLVDALAFLAVIV